MSSAYHILGLPIVSLFAIIATGMWLGTFRIRGVSLGAAGVLFVALLAGSVRHRLPAAVLSSIPNALTLPRELTDLGLLLFVFAVGLQAGPRFFSMFRSRGKAFLTVGFGSVLVGAVLTVALAKAFRLDPALAAGLFTGAVTNTPALAAARDAVGALSPADLGVPSVGYGLAYPFSVLFTVILVQVLPALLRIKPVAAADQARRDQQRAAPPLSTRQFRVTNPNLEGKTVSEFAAAGISRATVSRVKREGVVYIARPDMTLRTRDIVLAVGPNDELGKLETVVGSTVDEPMADPSGSVVAVDLLVSNVAAVGRSIGDLDAGEEFGVVVTRLRREGIEWVPSPSLELEPGDMLRVVGHKRDVDAFEQRVGRQERRLDETSLVPFAAGLALGAALGMVPLPIPGQVHPKLGLGGGAFIVALLLGHLGHLGRWRVYVPTAAKTLSRELGLVIFLAGAGLEAGEKLPTVFSQAGPQVVFVGTVVTLATVSTALAVMHWGYRWNLLTTLGTLSGVMTNPPALNASSALTDSDAPAVAFASIYPVVTISKILLAQAVYVVLRL